MKVFGTALLLLALTSGIEGQEGKDALQREMEQEIMAPCCYGGPVSEHESEAALQVRGQIRQLLSEGRAELQAKLVARELMDPTQFIEQVVNDGIRPQVELVFSLIRKVVGQDFSEQQLRRCTSSIFGQCLFYCFARPVIERIPLEDQLSSSSIEALAEHITQFSMAALVQMTKQK